MQTIIPTIYSYYLQKCLYQNYTFELIRNTTLNEYLSILPSTIIPSNTFPHLEYFCIGTGGHQHSEDQLGYPKTVPKYHKPHHANLYELIPFVLRPSKSDLSNEEKQRFALRKKIMINDKEYIAYYLRRLDKALDSRIEFELLEYNDLELKTETFTPDYGVLTPLEMDALKKDFIQVSSTIHITFTKEDLDELINVGKILFNNPYKMVISEIGLCSGIDYPLEDEFKEVIATQINAFVSGYYPIMEYDFGIEIPIETALTEAIEPYRNDTIEFNLSKPVNPYQPNLIVPIFEEDIEIKFNPEQLECEHYSEGIPSEIWVPGNPYADQYQGVVLENNFITINDLIREYQFNERFKISSDYFVWHHFILDEIGEVFVASTPILSHISFQELLDKKLVYGDTVITIGSHRFKIRLLKGLNQYCTKVKLVQGNQIDDSEDGKGSEYNRTIIRLHHQKAISQIGESFSEDYTNNHLYIGSNLRGKHSWCQETILNQNQYQITRGGDFISHLNMFSRINDSVEMGWRPVLEWVK